MSLPLPADKVGCLGPVEEYAAGGSTPSKDELPSKPDKDEPPFKAHREGHKHRLVKSKTKRSHRRSVNDDAATDNGRRKDRTTARKKHSEVMAKQRNAERDHAKRGESREGLSMKSAKESCFVDDLESVLHVTQYSSYDGKFVVSSDFLRERIVDGKREKRNDFVIVPKDSIKVTKERRNAEGQNMDYSISEAEDIYKNINKHHKERDALKKIHANDSKINTDQRDVYCRNINRPSVNNAMKVEKYDQSRNERSACSIGRNTRREDTSHEKIIQKEHISPDGIEVKTLWKNLNRHNENTCKTVTMKMPSDMSNKNNKEVKTLWKCPERKPALNEMVYESVKQCKHKMKKDKTKVSERTSQSAGSRNKLSNMAVYGRQEPNNVYVVHMNDGTDKNTGLPKYPAKVTGTAATTIRDGFKPSVSSFHRDNNINQANKEKNNVGGKVKEVVSRNDVRSRGLFYKKKQHKSKSEILAMEPLKTQTSTNNKTRFYQSERKKSIIKDSKNKIRRVEMDKKTVDWTGTETYAGIPSPSDNNSKPSRSALRARLNPPSATSKDFKCVAEVFSTDPGDATREHLSQTISQLNVSKVDASPEEIHTYEPIDIEQCARLQKRIKKDKRIDISPSRPKISFDLPDKHFPQSAVTVYQVSNVPVELPANARPQPAHPNTEGSAQNTPTNRDVEQGLIYPILDPNEVGRGQIYPTLHAQAEGSGENYGPRNTYTGGQEHRPLNTQYNATGRGQTYPIQNPYDVGRGPNNRPMDQSAVSPGQMYPTQSPNRNEHGQMYPPITSYDNGQGQIYPTLNPNEVVTGHMYPTLNPNPNVHGIINSVNPNVYGRGSSYPAHPNINGQSHPMSPNLNGPGCSVIRNVSSSKKPYSVVVHGPGNVSTIVSGPTKPTSLKTMKAMNQPMSFNMNAQGHPGNPNVHGPGYYMNPNVSGPGHPMSPYSGPGQPMNPNSSGPGYSVSPYVNRPGQPINPYIGGPGQPMNPYFSGPGYSMNPYVGGPGHPMNPNVFGPGQPINPNVSVPGYPMNSNVNGPGYPPNHNVNGPGSYMNPNSNGRGYPMNTNLNGPGNSMNPNVNGSGYSTIPTVNGYVSESGYPTDPNGNGRGTGFPANPNGYGRGTVYPMNPNGNGRGPTYPIMNANIVQRLPTTNNYVTSTTNSSQGLDNNVESQLRRDQQKRKSIYSKRDGPDREHDHKNIGQIFENGNSLVYHQSRASSGSGSSSSGDKPAPPRRTPMQGKHSHDQDATVPCGCGQEMRIRFALAADNTADCVICIRKLKEEFTALLDSYKLGGYEGCSCKSSLSVTDLVMEYLKGDNYPCTHGKESVRSAKSVEREQTAKRCEERKRNMEEYVQKRLQTYNVAESASQHQLQDHTNAELKYAHSTRKSHNGATSVNEDDKAPRKKSFSDSTGRSTNISSRYVDTSHLPKSKPPRSRYNDTHVHQNLKAPKKQPHSGSRSTNISSKNVDTYNFETSSSQQLFPVYSNSELKHGGSTSTGNAQYNNVSYENENTQGSRKKSRSTSRSPKSIRKAALKEPRRTRKTYILGL